MAGGDGQLDCQGITLGIPVVDEQAFSCWHDQQVIWHTGIDVLMGPGRIIDRDNLDHGCGHG